jgi:hypothetical protein
MKQELDNKTLAEANERLAKMGVTGNRQAQDHAQWKLDQMTISHDELRERQKAALSNGATVAEEAQTILQTAAPSQAPVRKRRSDAGVPKKKPETPAPGRPMFLNGEQAARIDYLVRELQTTRDLSRKQNEMALEAERSYFAYLNELQGK